jgi:molybdopterin/thiamine biosynthesis adenylyltransferase
MRIKIIGIGGIGTHLVPPLCRYFDSCEKSANITLLDGDQFEPKNINRQDFELFGNKAESIAKKLLVQFPDQSIESKPVFLADENIFVFIKEGDMIFLCVDNHATRKLVSDYCQTLKDVTLISGGNDYTDGNVQIFIRKEGKNLTPPLTHLHPEIENPKDKNPAEMSCEELSRNGSPQLIFTNLAAASHMLSAFWLITEKGEVKYTEQYFDLLTGAVRPVTLGERP